MTWTKNHSARAAELATTVCDNYDGSTGVIVRAIRVFAKEDRATIGERLRAIIREHEDSSDRTGAHFISEGGIEALDALADELAPEGK